MTDNKDLNYAFNLSRQCSRLIGIWPEPYMSLNEFRWSRIRFIIAVSTISFYVFIPQIINVIRAGNNLMRMTELFVAANFSFMALCKLLVTRYYGDKLRTIIASVKTDWVISKNDWERDTILKIAKYGRFLSFRYFTATIGTIIFAITFYLHNTFYRSLNQPRRNLAYRFDYIQKSPYYEITFFIQLTGGAYSVLGNYTVDSFVSILVLHVCAQLINLRTALSKLVDKLTNRSISSLTFKEGLTAIVERHKHLIRTAEMINDCYSIVLCIHLFAAIFQLCLITFQVFTMITNNISLPIIRMIFLSFYIYFVVMELYSYCYAAEKLLTESTRLAYGVFECKWYNLPPKDAKTLMLIVYQSNIPLRLTAGKFVNFSMELFGTAIRTSVGYVSALLSITSQ